MGTAQRDVGYGRERGKVSTFPSFPPYFISRSLPSRPTPLSKRLEQAMILAMIIITNMIMIIIMTIYIIIIPLSVKTLNVSNFREKIKSPLLNVLGNEDNYLNANYLIEYFVKLT